MADQLRPSPFFKPDIFSEGLLAGLFSRGDALKRKTREAAADPRAFLTGLLAPTPPEKRTSDAERSRQFFDAFGGSVMPGVNDLEREVALGDLVEGASDSVPGGMVGRMTKAQVQKVIKRAIGEQKRTGFGGATVDPQTMRGATRGDRPAPGYAVARKGPMGKSMENVVDELNLPNLNEYVSRPDVLAALNKPGARLGLWEQDGKWYMDVSGIHKGRKSASDAVITRGEQSSFKPGLSSRTPDFPDFAEDRRARAMYNAQTKGLDKEAQRLTDVARNEPRPAVPDGPEYWPWRVERGGYDLKYNAPDGGRGAGHYSINKTQSADEKRLSKAIKAAEDKLASGNLKPLFGPADVYEQPTREFSLNVPYPKKAMPAWLQQNLTDPGIEARLIDAYQKGVAHNPLAPEWYGMGRLYDDLAKRAKGDVPRVENAMERFGNYMGTTTASSKPPQNVRTATYHIARANQGLPVGEVVQAPYGHKMYGTHADAMRSLEELGYIDPMANPKGASFSGNISGLSDDATLDKVMSNNMPLLDASGRKVDAPPYYGPARDVFGEIAGKHGLKPKQLQAGSWVGFNKAGGTPLMQVLGNRIAVTSEVTGIPQSKVYKAFMRLLEGGKKEPGLLSTGLLALPDDERD